MANNNNKICVYDYETGGTNPLTTPILSIGAVIVEPTDLKIIDEFYSLSQPDEKGFAKIQDGALAVNNLTREEIKKAVPEKIVWKDFTTFIGKHKKGTSNWNNCIESGFNITGFDSIITERMCKLYGPYDKKEGRSKLFRPFPKIDAAQIIFSWFENETEPFKLGLTSIAEHLGIDTTKAHNSLEDSRMTAQILIKFLKFQRNIMEQYREKIKGCFLPKEE